MKASDLILRLSVGSSQSHFPSAMLRAANHVAPFQCWSSPGCYRSPHHLPSYSAPTVRTRGPWPRPSAPSTTPSSSSGRPLSPSTFPVSSWSYSTVAFSALFARGPDFRGSADGPSCLRVIGHPADDSGTLTTMRRRRRKRKGQALYRIQAKQLLLICYRTRTQVVRIRKMALFPPTKNSLLPNSFTLLLVNFRSRVSSLKMADQRSMLAI